MAYRPQFTSPEYGWNQPGGVKAVYNQGSSGGLLGGSASGGGLFGGGSGYQSLQDFWNSDAVLPTAAALIAGPTFQQGLAGAFQAAGAGVEQSRKRRALNDVLKATKIAGDLSPETQAYLQENPEFAQKLISSKLIPDASLLTADQRNYAAAGQDPAFGAFLNRQKPGSEALEIRRYTLAANAAVRPYMEHPVYKLASMAAPMMSRIEQASTIPGSVADQELLDTVTKLNTAGGQITEAQVNLVLKGQSFADKVAVWQNYLAEHGGVLSDDQRHQLLEVAHAVNRGYQKLYGPVHDAAVKAMKDRGIPEDYWGAIPDLNALSVAGGIDPATGAIVGAAPAGAAPAGGAPPVAGAKQAPDGNWYVPDPARPGKYLMVQP